MVELCSIEAGQARLQLAPALGGGIARLDVGGRPVLRPWNRDETDPFSLACNVLVPFSNRISRGGIDWNGRHYPLEPNLSGEAFPIHGDGFQRAWAAQVGGASARLTLENGSFGPWQYRAEQQFSLTETAMTVALAVTNTGLDPLPFGCGFHPWFPRNADTRLAFEAAAVWMEDERHLPTHARHLEAAPDWNFATARPLPDTLINNGYTGWHGPATITQGDDAMSCSVQASDNLDTALIYSPDETADFFCFEPVSHPVDAFHWAQHPGLTELRPQETLRAQMRISWSLE
jgi:aldose 1-epimerase